jgi:hypothetical protein
MNQELFGLVRQSLGDIFHKAKHTFRKFIAHVSCISDRIYVYMVHDNIFQLSGITTLD